MGKKQHQIDEEEGEHDATTLDQLGEGEEILDEEE